MKNNKLFRLIIVFLMINPAVAISKTIHLNNVWLTQSGFVNFGENRDWFSQLDVHLRLNTFEPRFRQNLDVIRIGKALNDNVDYAVGFGYLPTQLLTRYINEQRFWQQLNVRFKLNNKIFIQMYNRVENRWIFESSGVSLRDRFKVILKTCKESWDICPFVESETFININRVSWDTGQTIAQQRSMVAIEKKISDTVTLSAGYLNQFLWFGSFNLSYDILSIQAAFNFN